MNKDQPISLDHQSDQIRPSAGAKTVSLTGIGRSSLISSGLDPIFGGIYRIVEAWAPLFTPPLRGEVVFTIQPGRGKKLGWFWCHRWQRTDNGQTLPEINLCADKLAGDVCEVANVIIHELTHYANWQSNIDDCSSSQYHKCSFKKTAESVGLVCSPWDKSKGWGFTSLSTDTRTRVESLGIDPTVFKLFRPRIAGASNKAMKMRRWECGNQTTLCRPVWRAAGTDLQAVCLACGVQFVKTERAIDR
jgi:hypothetical protein